MFKVLRKYVSREGSWETKWLDTLERRSSEKLAYALKQRLETIHRNTRFKVVEV